MSPLGFLGTGLRGARECAGVCTQSMHTCNGTVWCERTCVRAGRHVSLRLPQRPSALMEVAGRPGSSALPLWGWGKGWGGPGWDSHPRSCGGTPKGRRPVVGPGWLWGLGPPEAVALSWWSREGGGHPGAGGGVSTPHGPLPHPPHSSSGPHCIRELMCVLSLHLALKDPGVPTVPPPALEVRTTHPQAFTRPGSFQPSEA